MNMHLPQSIQTEQELAFLSAVQSQIISPRESKPIIAVLQDIVSGFYLLTKDGSVTNKQFMNIISNTSKFMGDIYNYPYNKMSEPELRHGLELMSYILPKTLNLTLNNGLYDKDKEDNERLNKVIIENGLIKQGTLDKGIFQKKTKGLVHSLFNEFGQEVTRDMFNDVQKIICHWLIYNGFSVGISDMLIDKEIQDQMDEEVANIDREVNEIIVKLHYGQIENNSIGLNNQQNFENEIMKILNKGAGKIEKIGLKKIGENKENRLMAMVESGAKGSKSNVKQIISGLGQQDIEGTRVPYGFEDRTLPHFQKFDDGTEARGYVRNSFMRGLSPQEFFFHAISGRNGLIDTAVKSFFHSTQLKTKINNEYKNITIGKFIDELLEKHKEHISYKGPEDANMELLNIKELGYNVVIPTGDENGKITFEELTHVTRHDPSEKLYKVTTKSGRDVIAVDSESFIIWDNKRNKFVKKQSSLLQIGDKLPKSLKINIPENLQVKEIKVENYISKTDLIFGNEFQEALQMYNDGLNERDKKGNIKQRNGTKTLNKIQIEFKEKLPKMTNDTLKKKFVKNELQKGYVYTSYNRDDNITTIEDSFKLDYNNGKLFGIYIADGCCDIKANSIRICNKNKNIQNFVESWFNQRGINGKVEVKNGQNSENYRFYSNALAKIFTSIFNHTASKKIIPEEFLYAPDEFIKGFLSGYLSCDCNYNLTSGITTHTASENISDNIAFMLNRFGIHTRYYLQTIKREDHHNNRHDLRIPTKYYQKLNQVIDIIDENKAETFVQILEKNLNENGGKDACYKKYVEVKDVLLDEIKEIEVLDSKGEKVYDVTVPKTLNFMISNGLVIRDTSESGYIQRKLIKAMEDAKINHDLTVRDALGNIVQFLYGEDGIDAVKYEAQDINYIEMTPQQMEDEFLISFKDEKLMGALLDEETLSDFNKIGNRYERCMEYYNKIVEDKRNLIINVFRKEFEKTLEHPVSLYKLINNAKITFRTNEVKRQSNIHPIEIIERLEKLEEELRLTKMNSATKNMGVLLRAYLSPKQVIKKYNFDKKVFNYIIEKIKLQFKQAIAHPSEMVGIVSAQSIGEPVTQLTLNSVEYNTELLIKVNGKLQKVKIGEWIDKRIDEAEPENIELHPKDTVLEYVKDAKIEIMACDENGKMMWDNISAVTKHPVVNKDGSNTLIKVKTESGREVIATKGKSFLTRQNNKILPKEGEDLRIGDYIPISNTFVELDHELYRWNIGKYIDKSKHVFMSEVEKAMKFREENDIKHGSKKCKDLLKDFKVENTDGRRIRDKWYKYGLAKGIFTLPFNRGDSFVDAYRTKYSENNTNDCIYKKNCIYPKSATMQSGHVPEYLVLDNLTGFFIGAYLAEGHSILTQVLISNIDNAFNTRINEFCERLGLKYHIDEDKEKMGGPTCKNPGHTKTLRIHSTILAELFIKLFGKTSDKKNIPVELLEGNKDFLKGIIDGYFSGDGCIKEDSIHVSSISRTLLEDISNILAKFNIFSKIVSREKAQEYNIIKRGLKARLSYDLSLSLIDSIKFKNNFNLTIKYKQETLKNMISKTNDIYRRTDKIPEVILTNTILKEYTRNDIYKLLNNKDGKIKGKLIKEHKLVNEDYIILQKLLNEEVCYDKVISIEEVENPNYYVYDLTCDITKNFMLSSLVGVVDTFHSSGVANTGTQTVRGVPRIKEIFSFSNNIKTPSMTIYLKDEYKKDLQVATELKNKIELTHMKQIVSASKIFYCPKSKINDVEGYGDFMRMFEIYEEYKNIKELSPWFMVFEFDKKKMFDLQIHMIDLEYILQSEIRNKYSEKFDVIYVLSDENSEKLALRINIISSLERTDNIIGDIKLLYNYIQEVLIKGVKGIKKVALSKKDLMEYNEDTNTFEKSYEWILQTDGINMKEILKYNEVEASRIYCNDINVMNEIFGIEVAKQTFIKELHDVLSGASVGNKHVSLLADIVTARGNLLSIDRHGINKSDIGPLAKCSFEETSEQLIKAGLFADYDNLKGVSANIMLGQIPQCGTGDSKILLDENKLGLINMESSLIKDKNIDISKEVENLCIPENLFNDTKPKEYPGNYDMEEFEVS
jgi:DNA-directed RNA polymerase beta' subunit